MKILFVRNLYWPEDFGGNRYPFEVSTRLAARGHDVHVVTGCRAGTAPPNTNAGVRISYFPVMRVNPLATHFTNAVSSIRAVGEALRQAPEAALVASYDVGLPYFARRRRPPTAFIYHSSFYSEAVERLRRRPLGRIVRGPLVAYMRAVERKVLGSADRIIAVSDFSVREIVERVPEREDRVELIPTGVDTDFFSPVPDRTAARAALGIAPDAIVGVVVGRLAGVKRYDRAIDAVRRLRADGVTMTLLMVGEGPERARLVEHAAQTGMTEAVRFMGFRSGDALREVLRAADVQMCSSEFENLSLALLEGLSTGVPVVSVPTGGTVGLLTSIDPELLADGANDEALARAVRKLLDDPDRRRRDATRGRELVVSRHDWNSVVERVERALSSIAAGAAPA